MKFLTIVPITFFVLSVLLLGTSITSFVISESCCFPPNCAVENVCDVAQGAVPEYNATTMVVGGMFLLLSVFTLRLVAEP